MTEDQVKNNIISFLSKKGWGKNLKVRELREHGCDIVLSNDKYARYFYIECKGDPKEDTKNQNSSREVAFIYSLGQIITRIKTLRARYYYGLGLPEKTAKIALRRISNEIAKELCLSILSVSENGEVKWYKSNSIGKN